MIACWLQQVPQLGIERIPAVDQVKQNRENQLVQNGHQVIFHILSYVDLISSRFDHLRLI